ncbi:D-arabinono-1,4-lactone oxidase [Motilimonas eburnea]|uniref:D-arabinono-1,4-lactone oxidase n=1 Tax=Motilimonas eburnea TaxID=1737488 RepID=UPI001E4E0CA2|nr:D-arabinono-1,4-lactone oxidase [Motilimonas eburnea]MCE2571155.1 hypothetical protein [Motilimonas eburnea]
MPVSQIQSNYYRPESIEEVIALVREANRNGQQVRVCGAAHSQSWAIYTNSVLMQPNVTNLDPPPSTSKELNLVLDKINHVELYDVQHHLVRAGAGVHLGYDPSDVTQTSTLENSLLYLLWHQYQLTVSELGGITHQTLGGFLGTGSAGGSLKYSFHDNIVGIHFVDGEGELRYANRDKDADLFHAVLVSMGLLGVIVEVELQCEPAFNICGQEATVSYQQCAFDFFGESAEKPSLLDFFNDVDYGRINWWPQPGIERLVPWQAQRQAQVVGFTPRPYQEFTAYPQVAEPVISIIYAILGNLDNPIRLYEKVQAGDIAIHKVIENIHDYKQFGVFGDMFRQLVELLTLATSDAFNAFVIANRKTIKEQLPTILAQIVSVFQPLDSDRLGISAGNPQVFQDHAPWGLPMDNEASDEFLDIEFSELWFPVGRSAQVMQMLRDYFDSETDPNKKLDRTGLFMIEVYMAKASQAWLSMGYSDQQDEWRDGAVRFEPLWFVDFAENPAERFYPQFWNLFKESNIPYRLHWGKMLPLLNKRDGQDTMAYIRRQYPKLADFLALRERLDPQQIFVTDYWRDHLQIPAKG